MWKFVSATVPGNRHITAGIGADDAHSVIVKQDGLFIAAVADGAGSYSGTSAWGAYVASRAAVEYIDSRTDAKTIRQLDDEALKNFSIQAVAAATQAVYEFSKATELTISDLSTTLSVAFGVSEVVSFAQVGDGITVVRDTTGTSRIIAERRYEEPNVTTFLRPNQPLDMIRTEVCREVDALALSTDGLEYMATNRATQEAFQPFFDEIWKVVSANNPTDQQFAEFLLGIKKDQKGDDKTMVSAVIADAYHRSNDSPLPIPVSTPGEGTSREAVTKVVVSGISFVSDYIDSHHKRLSNIDDPQEEPSMEDTGAQSSSSLKGAENTLNKVVVSPGFFSADYFLDDVFDHDSQGVEASVSNGGNSEKGADDQTVENQEIDDDSGSAVS